MWHMCCLKKPAPGADNTEPVFQIPAALPSIERGRRVKKDRLAVRSTTTITKDSPQAMQTNNGPASNVYDECA